MRLRDTFGLALTALSRNKMRSLLTTLGVVLLLRHRKPKSKASASAAITPTGIWLRGRF